MLSQEHTSQFKVNPPVFYWLGRICVPLIPFLFWRAVKLCGFPVRQSHVSVCISVHIEVILCFLSRSLQRPILPLHWVFSCSLPPHPSLENSAGSKDGCLSQWRLSVNHCRRCEQYGVFICLFWSSGGFGFLLLSNHQIQSTADTMVTFSALRNLFLANSELKIMVYMMEDLNNSSIWLYEMKKIYYFIYKKFINLQLYEDELLMQRLEQIRTKDAHIGLSFIYWTDPSYCTSKTCFPSLFKFLMVFHRGLD